MDLIKKFNEYFDKIEESINSPKSIDWENTEGEYIGKFSVEDIDYRIEYLRQIGNNWSYSFSYFDINKNIWSYEISHKGTGGFAVLSTVKSGLYYVYEKTSPNSIIFSAIDYSETRKRLYQAFCEEFCEKNKWKFSNRGTEDKRLFLMFNDKVSDSDKEEIMLSVKKIVESGK